MSVADIAPDGGRETVEQIRVRGGDAEFFEVDVTDEARVRQMIDGIVGHWGGLHLAYNNAGVEGQRVRLHETSTDHWHRVMSVNVDGIFYCLKYELAHMVEHGGGANCQRVVHVRVGRWSSWSVPRQQARGGGTDQERGVGLRRRGIRVNSIHPGAIDTPMIERLRKDPLLGEALATMHPMGRIGTPEEIADAVVWLCSDGASFVTGHTLVVDGGNLAR